MLSNRDLAVSAGESMNLVIYFCLLVGDYVCETCNVWKYYLLLNDLVDFKTNSSVREHYSGT